MIPRFLFDDTSEIGDARVFVVHTQKPRFVGELVYDGEDLASLAPLVIAVDEHHSVAVLDCIDPPTFDANSLIPALRTAILNHASIRG